MADLNVNTTQIIRGHENVGQNLVVNGDFENAPSFTAATTTNQRWIDGTAGGSSTNDVFYWAIVSTTGTVSTQFDSSLSHGGINSLKLSTLATGSQLAVRLIGLTTTVASINHYGIPVLASTSYIFSFWATTTLNSGDATTGASVQILEYGDAATTTLATRGTTKILTSTGWTQYTFSFTTTSTTVYVTPSIIIQGNDGAATLIMDAWFDDLSLTPTARQAGVDVQMTPIVTPGVQNISGPKIWS